ncbi:hypothetical protein [Paracoccus sp. KR1-242]|uniref:hypothetical protein n=1 Tax=Paracoccus sp. KR1-242 TaxID=3410028 RepID=UPI003C1027CA
MRQLVQLAAEVAEMKRQLAASHRQGVVSEVDAAEGLVRLDLGEGMLSPWIPYVQTAGALKVHSPPSPGQMMAMIAPSGETSQGFATALSFGAGNAPPSTAADQHVITFGGVRIELTADGISASVGGVTLTLTADGLEIDGGEVTHDGTNIGSDHVHGGIERGDENSDGPH